MRLIDADALKETLRQGAFSSVMKVIDRQPTLDAVPVVRCKDCRHFTRFKERAMCTRTAIKENGSFYGLTATFDEHYCSYGSKIGEEATQNESIK